jgi:acetyl-CoA synthetase
MGPGERRVTWYITEGLTDCSYTEAHESFEWDLPADFNLARDCLRKHDDTVAQVALFQEYPDGRTETYTFADIDRHSDGFAACLRELGVGFGDRVAVTTPQKPALPVTLMACWKLGAIAVPLSVLFGEEALRYRLADSGATIVVADESAIDTVRAVADDCPDLTHFLQVDGEPSEPFQPFDELVRDAPDRFHITDTDADTPALIVYTSGTTGPPKGVLHTHGFGPGKCTGWFMYTEHTLFHEPVFWSPSDWAWILGPGMTASAWHHGRPIVGYPMESFDPVKSFELMERYRVTNPFLPPTAVRMMMNHDPKPYDLALVSIISGGEALTQEIREWAEDALNATVNEVYGQTEATPMAVTCHEWFDVVEESLGKPVVGHDVAVVDADTGEELPRGELGELAIRYEGDPLVFDGYWNEPEKTAETRVNGWHLTGDLGRMEADEYVTFEARSDDVIITSGYRVGPEEVESTVLQHPDVEQVGVVGVPDETRGEIIKAVVQVVPDATPSGALREEIKDLVRDQLAAYEYPREIEFTNELPMTTTGKIQRRKLREDE